MTRLIDADALLEAMGQIAIIAYHKNIVDQCEAYIKKYQYMTGFGYEVDQANKRLRLHKQYMDDITNLITNAPTVQREGWVSVPTDEMVKVLMVELLKINYLSHPDVPYEGTASGDSPDDWHRRVIKYVLTKTLSSAPKE